MILLIFCRASGNGNCLYNACSMALIGDESLANCLRALTCIELYVNASYYIDHPHFDNLEKTGKVSKKSSFMDSLSHQAFDNYVIGDYVSAVYEEAQSNVGDAQYSSFLCLLALSTAIGQPIESYYPIVNDDQKDVPLRKTELIRNGCIMPRESISNEKVQMFQCAAVPIEYLYNKIIPERKDHFVPLFPPGKLTDATKKTDKRKRQSTETVSNLPKGPRLNVIPFVAPKVITIDEIPFSSHPTPTRHTKALILQSAKRQVKIDTIFKKCSQLTQEKSFQPLNALAAKADTNQTTAKDSETVSSQPQQNDAPELGSQSTADLPLEQEHVLVDSPVNDIAKLYKTMSTLPDVKKQLLLTNIWKPESTYCFPPNASGRKFQYKWLDRFPWLVYSRDLDGAFCINCVAFGGESTHNASKLSHLFKTPLTDWSKAIARFHDHVIKSKVHDTSTIRAGLFRAFILDKSKSVDVQLDSIVSRQVEANRAKLVPIVEAIILCGRQNIALRGHRDDSKYFDNVANNSGNLQAILSYLVKCGDNKLFEEHIQNAQRSATYRSKTTQNEIVRICGLMIMEKILSELKEAKYFSILADEAADISNLEQMAIVLRFVDKSAMVREVFLGFFHCNEGLSGREIANMIMKSIEDLGLNLSYCRGQGYDGAGNMAGKCNGASTLIQRQYPQALYVHCKSHVLNLCVASACTIQLVRNMMGHVRVVSQFFNVHPKRFALLSESIHHLLPLANHKHLIDVCRTRWIARIDGLAVFIEVFVAIVDSLESIKNNVGRSWNGESVKDANGLFYATISFEFIVCLVIVSRLLEITMPLTKQLQSPAIDVIASVEKVTLLFSMLQRIREEITESHDEWYDEAVRLADSVGTVPSSPRTARVQIHRANTPADTPSEYYRRVISIPFLDHLSSQIQTRFSQRNVAILDAFYALPSSLFSDPTWMEKFSRFLSLYKLDLPEPRFLKTELKSWENYWKLFQGTVPTTLGMLLPCIDKLIFPNISVALQIAATIPVTSCSCERSISVIRRLKTFLRNTMGQNRLNGLAMLHVHREIKLESTEVIERFALEHPRRMKLVDILHSDPTVNK